MQYPTTTDRSAMSAPRFDGSQACAGADIELFFPSRRGAHTSRALAAAKSLCAGCRYLEPCLDYALYAQGSPGRFVSGVWGGTTEAERLAIRKGRGHVRHPVAMAS
jgi:WhiB family redox-sensing transcriptional regulator